MASTVETIMGKLVTLATAVKIGGVAAFSEVTQTLRPPDAAKIRPACDLVVDTDRHIGFVDGVPHYELRVSVAIIGYAQPGVVPGKTVGDLLAALRTALWADRCLTGSAKTFQMGEWDFFYPLTDAGGERLGATAELVYTYFES